MRQLLNKKAIYLIQNVVNDKIYIGSAIDYKRRFRQHLYELNHNTHDNLHFQRSFNKYGKNKFLFLILEKIENKEDLISREQFWIDKLNPEYNIRRFAQNNLGCTWKMPEIAKQKISQFQKQRIKTQEHLSNISKALTGIKRSEVTKQKISNSKKGKPWTKARRDAQLKKKDT